MVATNHADVKGMDGMAPSVVLVNVFGGPFNLEKLRHFSICISHFGDHVTCPPPPTLPNDSRLNVARVIPTVPLLQSLRPRLQSQRAAVAPAVSHSAAVSSDSAGLRLIAQTQRVARAVH